MVLDFVTRGMLWVCLLGSVLAPDQCSSLGSAAEPAFASPPSISGLASMHRRQHMKRHQVSLLRRGHPSMSSSASSTTLSMSLLSRLFEMGQKVLRSKDARQGVIVRCAVRGPPSPAEAPNRSPDKPAVGGFWLGPGGADGDYNQYRMTKLKGTGARAVSVLTEDLIGSLNAEGWPVKPGDLGENLLVAGVPYNFFAVGRTYALGGSLVRITEPIAPCRNLCRLPFLSAPQCLPFVQTLNNRRGWYGRVVTPGHVATGDVVAMV